MAISIILGTAQFGLNYGITNYSGKVNEQLVKNILYLAEKNNVKFLDTAQNYGNAEEVIGRCKSKESKFKIISKFSLIENNIITEKDINSLEEKFNMTLINLKCNSINSLLVHDSKLLKNKNSKIIFEWLVSLRNRKLIENIGISIYNLDELSEISLDNIDLIQIPISLYNQEATKGNYLERLSKKGYLIHARSIFLQGLLLESSKNWPQNISEKFKEHHLRTERIVFENNFSMLDLCLAYIKNLNFIDGVVVGLTNITESEEFFNSWFKKTIIPNSIDFRELCWDNKKDIDPRFWKKNEK